MKAFWTVLMLTIGLRATAQNKYSRVAEEAARQIDSVLTFRVIQPNEVMLIMPWGTKFETEYGEYISNLHATLEAVRRNDKIILKALYSDTQRLNEYKKKMLRVLESKDKILANHASVAEQMLLELGEVQAEYLPKPRFRK